MHRRELLPVIAGILLPGCASGEEEDQPYIISEMSVRNWDDTAHEMAVEVRAADGNVVFSDTVQMGPPEGDDSGLGDPDGEAWGRITEDPGYYTVRVRIDGGEWTEYYPGQYLETCGQVEVEIDEDGEPGLLTGGCTISGYTATDE
jgi:hypothetical protein